MDEPFLGITEQSGSSDLKFSGWLIFAFDIEYLVCKGLESFGLGEVGSLGGPGLSSG